MKILFISSGNNIDGISPIIKNQGQSLVSPDIDIQYFTINGKGIKGYFKHILLLRKLLKQNAYDLFHAHYSFSAIVASLAGARPLVVSLMGSDVKGSRFFRFLCLIFNKLFWSKLIVKSEEMKHILGISDIQVLPNGVDLSMFYPQEKEAAKQMLNWDLQKKHILFASNPARHEKNFSLVGKSIRQLKKIYPAEVHVVFDVPNQQMPLYINASDVVVLTSLWEGSPNIVKEAMACNCPVVSTRVGDIEWLLNDVQGCSISEFAPEDFAAQLVKVLDPKVHTDGRKKLIDLQLDAALIASRLTDIYREVLNFTKK